MRALIAAGLIALPSVADATADEWLLRQEMETMRLQMETDAIRRDTALREEMRHQEFLRSLEDRPAAGYVPSPSLAPPILPHLAEVPAPEPQEGCGLLKCTSVGGFTEHDFYCSPMPTDPVARKLFMNGAYRR